MRILHVLHNSLPVLCGYSVRSAAILRHQQQRGLEPVVVTSAQNPYPSRTSVELIDGIRHFRTPSSHVPQLPGLRERALMKRLRQRVEEVIASTRPDVVHAHSPVLVGLPALQAARDHGLPFVYEVRDLWENASVDRGRFKYNSPLYHLARQVESHVLFQADAVVTICEALRSALAPRVADPRRLRVVSNGVDADALEPRGCGADARKQWGLEGKRVLAYVGTFQPYEGLDLLVRAMPLVLSRHADAHLLIAGGAADEGRTVENALRALADDLGVAQHVTFTGRLPHAAVPDIYAAAEIAVYPRLLTRTTALTTPLKPLEAMAMGRAVIASDVPAMREIVQDGVTGLVFGAGSVHDLAAQCVRALDDPASMQALSERARKWVVAERRWDHLVGRYSEIYREVASSTSFLAEGDPDAPLPVGAVN